MRKELMTALALAVAASSASMAENEIPVQVYLQTGDWPDPPLRVEKIVNSVFARIGVKLLCGSVPCRTRLERGRWLGLDLSRKLR